MKMETRPFQNSDETAVVQLWRDCNLVVSHNDPRKDIKRKLAIQPDLFLVGVNGGQIVATVMAGYEGHRGWLNYLAVAPALQRSGLGRQMIAEAEKRLRALGCPKINLQVRRSNAGVMEFYKTLGFAEDDVASMGKRLEED
jgi:ribosomal protein S18 acetylase RimI-like enzyme